MYIRSSQLYILNIWQFCQLYLNKNEKWKKKKKKVIMLKWDQEGGALVHFD